MPKTIVVSNLVLLSALSILAGSALFSVVTESSLPDRSLVEAVSRVAWVTAAIMVITELFSGARWPPLIAAGCLIIGAVATQDAELNVTTAVAWTIGWVAVAWWFSTLVASARENR